MREGGDIQILVFHAQRLLQKTEADTIIRDISILTEGRICTISCYQSKCKVRKGYHQFAFGHILSLRNAENQVTHQINVCRERW